MENKNSSNNITMIILLVVVLLLGGFVVYDKLLKKTNTVCPKCEENECQTNECPQCEACNCPNTTCNKEGFAGEQLLFGEIGKVYISTKGEVYFNPNEEVEFREYKLDMRNYAKGLFGNPKIFDIKSDKFMEGHYVFSYKLDLTDVRSVSEFYFGNGGTNFTLLFLHNNGNVSELSYDGENMRLYKNVSGYTNVVSIVEDDSEGGYGARLYDKCGNGKYYTSPRFN